MSDFLASSPQLLNVCFGDDMKPVQLTFAQAVDANGVPVGTHDMSGWDISAQVRLYPNAPDVLAEPTVDYTSAEQGEVLLWLDDEDRAALRGSDVVWDCRRTSPDAATLFAGTATVGGDISRLELTRPVP